MDAPLRWGILSTALINDKLLRGAALAADTSVVAVASRDADRARAYAERWSIGRAHDSYDALLADPEVDAVYVPLPNALHHPWTVRALEAGKHVLCEKPYSRHPDEVVAAFDLADERGLVLSEAYMFRYHPQTRRLAELVASGVVGELRTVVGAFSWPTPRPDDVRLDPELDGGSLLDVGCYPLSAARLLAGEPERVTGQLVRGPSGVEVRFAGTLSFADGVLAVLDSGLRLPDRSHLEVVGSTGTLVVADPWHCFEPGIVLQPQDGPPATVEVERANSYQLELEAFGREVARRRGAVVDAAAPALLGRADALGQATAIAALYQAAERRTAVDVGRSAVEDAARVE